MRRWPLVLFAIIALASERTFASGFGWYVASLEWTDFLRLRPELDRLASDLATAEGKPIDNSQRYGALFQMLDVNEGSSSPVPLVDESPIDEEFYWPDAFRYAAEIQAKQGIRSFFALFARGRSLWPSPEDEACTDLYYCYDTYVVLSPDEVTAFLEEITALNSETPHPDDYVDYLTHLEGVLLKASSEGRALFFQGHD
jgi:hypothetical protein